MQSVSSRIWTHVAVPISYDDNHYTTGTSSYRLRMYYFLSIYFLSLISESCYHLNRPFEYNNNQQW